MRDVNDAIENADPEKKFAPFVRTLQGVAGGFAAAQGAAALFSSESEDLQKTLVKVQGAMALSQGLNSLLELRNDFGDLAKMISTKVVSAFTTLRGALMGTGILLIASAVATLAANWEELLGWIEKSFPAFKKISAFFSNFKQMASGALASVVEGFKVVGDVVAKIFSGDFSGAIKSAKEFGSRVATAYNEGYEAKDKELKMQAALKERKFAIDMAEAQGKDVLAVKLKYLQDELTLLEKGSEEYNAKLIEIEQTRTEIRKKANERRKLEELKKAEEKKQKELK